MRPRDASLTAARVPVPRLGASPGRPSAFRARRAPSAASPLSANARPPLTRAPPLLPADVADAADADAVVSEAQDLEKRIHTLSGRIAQLDMNLRTSCDDLTAIRDSMTRLRASARAIPGGDARRTAAERALYQATLVMRGTGPAGALDGYLKPPKNGTFMKLFLGGAVELASQRQENRLKVKEEYYAFRDRSTLTYVAWPLALLYLNTQRKARIEAGMTHTGLTLVTVFPVLVQCYWVWMLYFYAALALRENVLRANGSNIRKWWINHHYYSMGMCLVVLTMDVQSDACLNYMSRFLVFTALQGVVMLAQNRYQRFRMYTRVAMGKASPMDVAGGEMGGNAGQLKVLYPLLFGLQVMQVYFGASVLVSVAREHGWIDARHDALAVAFLELAGVADGGWKRKKNDADARGAPRDVAEFFREWQAPCAGALFIVMGAGNFKATIQTYLNKRRYAKKAKMA